MPKGRSRKNKPLLASHQKSWIWGRNAVLEALRGGRWPVVQLLLARQLGQNEIGAAEELAHQRGWDVRMADADRLTQLCHRKSHQGYLAKMGPYPYVDSEEILRGPGVHGVVLVLDGLEDPQNFGTILRTAEVLGVDGVFVERSHRVGVTAAVARSSAGAVHHLAIAEADFLELADRLGQLGAQRICATEKADLAAREAPLGDKPVALIIGNEARGVREALRSRCDVSVRICQRGRIGSLNAAMAAGILLYEVHRRRDEAASGQSPRA
jgi:23S rRNA (guanosine2251-2'-O)-methyltransferase